MVDYENNLLDAILMSSKGKLSKILQAALDEKRREIMREWPRSRNKRRLL